MKRKITLLSIIVLAALSSFAYRGESRLHLNLFNDGQFTVVVDGQRYTNVQGQLVVSGLNPGTHRIRVVEHFFGRRGHHQERSVLYVGSVNVPFRSIVYAQMTNHNRLRIQEIRKLPVPRANRGRYYRDYRGNRGYGYDRDYQNRGNRDGYRGRRGGEPVNRHARSNVNAFGDLKFTLKQTAFDKDRLRIAKQFASSNRMNSAEVAQVMEMFSFESNRLNFAKFAWHHVVDPQNYFNVNRAFSFSKSVRELDRYIAGNN